MDSPATTQTSTLHKSPSAQDLLNWQHLRRVQLKWYNGDIVVQDKEILDFVANHNIEGIRYIGDSKHLELLVGKKSDVGNMCIYLIKSAFDIDHVISTANQALAQLPQGGILYMALNKFLLEPTVKTTTNANYESALYEYITNNIQYPVLRYHSGEIDSGQRFNWIHPLTRFYFVHENTNKN